MIVEIAPLTLPSPPSGEREARIGDAYPSG